MFDRKKKMLRKNRYVAAVSALLLAGMLSGCAGSGGNGAAQDGTSQDSAAQEESVGSQADAAQSAGEESQAAPVSFEAQDMEGNAVTADIFGQSKLTMVNVWATYCNPCLREMPGLGELAAEYDRSEFQIIGVVSDVTEGEDQTLVESLVQQTGAQYTHLLANDSIGQAILSSVDAVPTTFFFDQEGAYLGGVVGSAEKSDWEDLIHELLEEQ